MDLYTWYYLLVEILAWSKGRPSYKFYRHFQKKDHWFSQRDTRLSLFALESSLVNMILCTSAPVALGFIFFLCTWLLVIPNRGLSSLIPFVQFTCRSWIQLPQLHPWRNHLWQVLAVWAPFGVLLWNQLQSSQLHPFLAMTARCRNIMFHLLKCLRFSRRPVAYLLWFPATPLCLLDAQETRFLLMRQCRLATPWKAQTLST